MPQINRIRIINFSYNNESRHITDEVFDLYQGENALFNLKNGGGKSVLIQLMMQPIVPKTRLMGRRIEDFFKGRKTPSYIMIEWKLEDQGGYLLTGICIANRESQSRYQEDSSYNSLKYFTFTSTYISSNKFDILSIPFVKKQGERIYIEEYKEARNLITSSESKYNLKFFDYDDRLEYSKHLNSFNISQDEWKTIILKINESEGGVIEIFEKCRTSQQLMNDWILKTVEKVVNKDEKELKKLEAMLENLADDMIENEKYIYEKEIFQDFLVESRKYFDKINDLVLSIEKEEKLEKKMAGLCYFLNKEIDIINKEVDNKENEIYKSEEELKRIDLEEKSKEYYDIKGKIDDLDKLHKEDLSKLEILKKKIESLEKDELILKASGEFKKINELKNQLAGLIEEIRKIKNSDENKERIKNLEYSLKINYKNKIARVNNKKSKLEKDKLGIIKVIRDCENEITTIENRKNKLHSDGGKIKGKIDDFEEYEKKIKEEIEIKYNRNLLYEIEEGFKEKYLNLLDNNIDNLKDHNREDKDRIEILEKEIIETEKEIKTLEKENSVNPILVSNIKEKINKYYNFEDSLKPVLDKHDIKWKKRFNHNENRLNVKKYLLELKGLEKDISSNISSILKNIYSIKKGTLHLPDEFVDFLVEEDILFETGENYLKNHEEGIRKSLIKKNPMLPFTFIFDDFNLEKLKNCKFDLSIYQVIPLTTYSQLNNTHNISNRTVEFSEDFNFICLFNDRILSGSDLESYIKELQDEVENKKEQMRHYSVEIENTEKDLRILDEFGYDEKYIYSLENKKEEISKSIEYNKKRLKDREGNKVELETSIKLFNNLIRENDDKIKAENNKVIKIEDFFLKNEEYIKNIRENKLIIEEISKIQKRKNRIIEEKKEKEEALNNHIKKLVIIDENINKAEIQLEKYSDSSGGTLIDEPIENMEESLRVLKSKITRDLDQLEKQKSKVSKEIEEKEAVLKSYDLYEEDYIQVRYDYHKLIDIQKSIKSLSKEEKEQSQRCQEIYIKINRYEAKLETIKEDIEKVSKILEPSQIMMNFKERRKIEKEKIGIEKNQIVKLTKIRNEYNTISTKIQVKIEIKNFMEKGYTVNINPKADYIQLNIDLKNIEEENKIYEKNVRRRYYSIKGKYKNKNINIDNIFSGLELIIEKAESDKDNYIKLGEKLLFNNELLENMIAACETRLENLEKNKKDMVQHSYLQGKQVYEEIQKIPENSKVKLEGKSRSIPMLRIRMEELEEVEYDNIVKMKAYIENCIGIIKQDMKDNVKTEDIRKKINKYMSTRELLNVISDLGKMSISAYKIDLNTKNSGYKKWEQVMKENSGGERFVSFFAVLVALMSYTRTSAKAVDDYKRNRDTKVLIMDNPFGPISSEHLLKPLFNIAEKYNTQLICLTDLKQNSILNCFNLIYMIKIRQNVFGTNEYLQLKKQIKDGADIKTDEMLEKAVFQTEQIPLV